MPSSADSAGLSHVSGRSVLVEGHCEQLACHMQAAGALTVKVACHLKMASSYLSNLSLYFLLGKETH